ncbi:MAG: hypothetical protein EAY75_06560 [Bacteroidetes bacterium]|nr:MAG: hypothetical protein EAY75_06560 [Bacteroidota bacterium]
MNEETKILLSFAEERLMQDTDVILTKLAVMAKVEAMFGRLADIYRTAAAPLHGLLPTVMVRQPKISRGEKHDQLPWVMLDYPGHFSKTEGQLAVRSFFWWGRYFSIQLQASGAYLPALRQILLQQKAQLEADGWQMALVATAWDYKLPLVGIDIVHFADNSAVLKVARAFPLQQLNLVERYFTTHFEKLAKVIEAAFRHLSDETGPSPDSSRAQFGL